MKEVKQIGLIVILIILVIGYGIQVSEINAAYKNPTEVTCNIGEAMIYGDYEVEINDYYFMEVNEIESIIPDYEQLPGIQTEDQKVIVVSAMVTKKEDNGTELELESKMLESIAWSNGIDLDTLVYLNEEPINLGYNLKVGESININIPFNLYSFQFKKSDWKMIEEREFSFVLNWYPIKSYIRLAKLENK